MNKAALDLHTVKVIHFIAMLDLAFISSLADQIAMSPVLFIIYNYVSQINEQPYFLFVSSKLLFGFHSSTSTRM